MDPFLKVIDGAGDIGVRRIFASIKGGPDTPRETIVSRLRQTAEYARERDVVVCMETHPPFAENAEKAMATLDEVDHPGLRFNFDTANVYYYNEGTDTINELKQCAHGVASVHLKDTDGGFHSPNFPPIGQGVVDFAGVFEILGATGFSGPYTLEIEGANVQGLDMDGRMDFLRQCVEYLKANGAMG